MQDVTLERMQERMQDINEGGKNCGTIQETMQEAGLEIPAVFPGGGREVECLQP